MPVDPNRESWKPGMGWEHAIADIDYVRGLAREMGGPNASSASTARGAPRSGSGWSGSSTRAASSRPARWSAPPTTTRTATCGASPRGPTSWAWARSTAGLSPSAATTSPSPGAAPTTSTSAPTTSSTPWRCSTASPASSWWRASATARRPTRRPATWACPPGPVVAGGGAAAHGAGGLRHPRLGGGLAGGAGADVALHGDGEGPLADLPLRPAGGAPGHRRDARQGGAGRFGDARARAAARSTTRPRPRRRRSPRSSGSSPTCPTRPATWRPGCPPTTRPTGGPRSCSTSSRRTGGGATTPAG